jgi:hypothetical protein
VENYYAVGEDILDVGYFVVEKAAAVVDEAITTQGQYMASVLAGFR